MENRHQGNKKRQKRESSGQKEEPFVSVSNTNTFGNVDNKIGKDIENLRWMDVCRRGKGEVKRKKGKMWKGGCESKGKMMGKALRRILKISEQKDRRKGSEVRKSHTKNELKERGRVKWTESGEEVDLHVGRWRGGERGRRGIQD